MSDVSDNEMIVDVSENETSVSQNVSHPEENESENESENVETYSETYVDNSTTYTYDSTNLESIVFLIFVSVIGFGCMLSFVMGLNTK